MKRKTLSLLLVLVMAVSLFPMSALATSYSDTANHWAQGEIERWSGAGILTGSDGSFRPDDSITRAEMATIFDRVMAYRTKATNSFTDLGNSWYTDAILRANAAGLMLGDGGTVRPNDNISRQEAAILVCRAIGLSEKSGSTAFADDSSIASWAKGYVTVAATAAKAEITVKGEVGSLTANAPITVDNQGKITKAEINADNVIMDGNKPSQVVVDSTVTEPPKGSDGKPVDGGGTPSTGGGGGGVVTPPAPTYR